MGYKEKLNIFEGPFDLLVYLIESARMDIYDIKVSEITAQYLEYVEEIKKTDVALSSEFMVLAATLIDIKSRMLLPRTEPGSEDGATEDPRTQLVEKLLEYKRFKNAAAFLEEGETRSRRIFEKPREDISQFSQEPDEYLVLSLDKFVEAFDEFLTKKRKIDEVRRNYERVRRQRESAEEKMGQITGIFADDKNKVISFEDTVKDPGDLYDVALSFASMLEMIKQQRLIASQKKNFGPIDIRAGQNIDREITIEENGGSDGQSEAKIKDM